MRPIKLFGVWPLAALLALTFSCGDSEEEVPDPAGEAPTAITVSPSTLVFAQAGETQSLSVQAPARPTIQAPDWITVQDGTFNKYQITYTLTAAENEQYVENSGVITISATGVSSVTVPVSQPGAEEPEIPEGPDDPGSSSGGGDNVATALAATLGLGWNMGNHFDAYYNGSWAGDLEGYPAEEAWGNPKATKATFTGLKAAGFTSVRIPVSWLNMIGEAPDYTIDATWMNRVYEVVSWAHEAGLSVIVNTHHDENHGVSNTYQWLDIKNAATDSDLKDRISAEVKAVWTQIADKFSGCGDWLIMEGFNELNDGGWGWSSAFKADPSLQCGVLNEWNQVFVDAVRATGGNNATRWLGVPTYAANPDYISYLTMPDDPADRIMISVHYYNPSEYTIGSKQYQQWGHTGQTGKKETWGDEDDVKKMFSGLYDNYVAKGIPVYIGEFGCSFRDKTGDPVGWEFFKYYLEYIVKAAKTWNLPCFVWDNGNPGYGAEHHAYIDHGTGEYVGNSKEVVATMVKAWFTEDSSYTLQSVYDSAPTP